MKQFTLVLSIFSLLFAVPAFGQSEEQFEFCTLIEQSAIAVMDIRQSGLSISEAFENLKKVAEGREDDYRYELLKEMTIEAYEAPRLMSPAMAEKASIEMGNKWFIDCLKWDLFE